MRKHGLHRVVPQGGGDHNFLVMDGHITSGMSVSEDKRTINCDTASGWTSVGSLLAFPTSGVWAMEVKNEQQVAGAAYPIYGLDVNVIPPTGYPHDLGLATGGGSYFLYNGAVVNGYFGFSQTDQFKAPAVFDMDNNEVWGLTPSFIPGVSPLKKGNVAMTQPAPYYFSVGISGFPCSFTINTGQEAFSADNEAVISALEVTLGKSINRGIWNDT